MNMSLYDISGRFFELEARSAVDESLTENEIIEQRQELTQLLLQKQMKTYVEDIFGLQSVAASTDDKKLDAVLQLLVNIRKEAKLKKDYQTSDRIRNELAAAGVLLKDEKDGSVSWSI